MRKINVFPVPKYVIALVNLYSLFVLGSNIINIQNNLLHVANVRDYDHDMMFYANKGEFI